MNERSRAQVLGSYYAAITQPLGSYYGSTRELLESYLSAREEGGVYYISCYQNVRWQLKDVRLKA